MNRRSPSRSNEFWRIEEIRKNIDAGWSLNKACAMVGTSLSTVHGWAKRYPQWQELLDYYGIIHHERCSRVGSEGREVSLTRFQAVTSNTWNDRVAFLPTGVVRI